MTRKCICVLAAATAGVLFCERANAQAFRVDMNSDNLMEAPNPDAGYSGTQGLDAANVPNGNPTPPFDPWFINGGRDSSGGDPRLTSPVFIDSNLSTPFTPHYPGLMMQVDAAAGDVIDSVRRFSLPGTTATYTYNELYRDCIFNTNTSAAYDPNSPQAGMHTPGTDGASPNGPMGLRIGGLTANTTYAVTFYTYDKWMDLDTAGVGQSVGVSKFRFVDTTLGGEGNTGYSAMYGRNTAPGGLSNDTWAVTMLVTTNGGGTMTFNEQARPDYGASGNTLNSAILNGVEINPVSAWQGGAGTNYSTAGNWTGAVPNGATQGQFNNKLAYFPQASAQTVNLDVPVTVSQMAFNSTNSYTVSGSSTLQVSGGGLSVLAGNHTIQAPVAATGNILNLTVVPSGSTLDLQGQVTVPDTVLTVPNPKTLRGHMIKNGAGRALLNRIQSSVVVLNGGTLAVRTNGSNTGLSQVGTIIIATATTNGPPIAAIDLNDNDMIVTGTNRTTVQGFIANARNGGAWDRGGITSTAAKNSNPKNKGLGVLTGAEYQAVNGPTFDGVTVANTDTLVKFTWYGDTDFNGVVNFDDYSRIDTGFNQGRTGWLNGDFDYSGVVNFDDYALMDLAFNTQSGTLRRASEWLGGNGSGDPMDEPSLKIVEQHYAQFGDSYAGSFLSAVPEPGSAAGAIMLTTALAARRRRRAR